MARRVAEAEVAQDPLPAASEDHELVTSQRSRLQVVLVEVNSWVSKGSLGETRLVKHK